MAGALALSRGCQGVGVADGAGVAATDAVGAAEGAAEATGDGEIEP